MLSVSPVADLMAVSERILRAASEFSETDPLLVELQDCLDRCRRPDALRHDYRQRMGPFGRIVDLGTGREIERCFFFDEATGEYGHYPTECLTPTWGRGRIKFFPAEPGAAPDHVITP